MGGLGEDGQGGPVLHLPEDLPAPAVHTQHPEIGGKVRNVPAGNAQIGPEDQPAEPRVCKALYLNKIKKLLKAGTGVSRPLQALGKALGGSAVREGGPVTAVMDRSLAKMARSAR